jgi:N-acetylneuraminic acid mutarotase
MLPLTKRSLTVLTCLSVALAACADSATQPGTAEGTAPGDNLAAAVNSWTTRANLPGIERGGLATAVVQNASKQSILYALGGRSIETGGSLGKVQAYNAATNTWSFKASMPIPVYSTNGAGVIDGKIYVSGGITRDKFFRNELQVYDPATDTWTLKALMPEDDTWGGVTGVLHGKLYVLTSINQEDSYLDFRPLTLYRYDPATDQWSKLASSPPQIRRPMGGFVGGKLYVTGDTPSGFGGAPLFHAYDPATNQWTSKTPLPRARFNGVGVPVGGKLYVIGGLQVDPDGVIRQVRTTSVYDPATDKWSELRPIPTDRPDASGSRIVRGGVARIAVVGGTRPGNNLEFTP